MKMERITSEGKVTFVHFPNTTISIRILEGDRFLVKQDGKFVGIYNKSELSRTKDVDSGVKAIVGAYG